MRLRALIAQIKQKLKRLSMVLFRVAVPAHLALERARTPQQLRAILRRAGRSLKLEAADKIRVRVLESILVQRKLPGKEVAHDEAKREPYLTRDHESFLDEIA